ncbi:MAG TPA: DNA translocase FtsK 4TM domain-containing protein, partial [Thermaerobacter sp.]
MSRQRGQSKGGGSDRLRGEATGIALLVLSGLAFVALVKGPAAGGVIGTHLAGGLTWTVGRAAWLLPPLAAWRGLSCLWALPLFQSRARNAGLALAVVLVAVLFTRPCEPLLATACVRAGGGVVGALAAEILRRAFGSAGSLLVLAALAILDLRLITGRPLAALGDSLGRRLAPLVRRARSWAADFFFTRDDGDGEEDDAGQRPAQRRRREPVSPAGPGEAGAGRSNGRANGEGQRSLVARLLQRAYLDGPAIVHDVETAGDARESGVAADDGTGAPAAPGREPGEGAGQAALPRGEPLPGEAGGGAGRGEGELPGGGQAPAGGGEAQGGAGGTAAGSERFRLPPIELLTRGRSAPSARFQREVADKAAILEETLASFGVQ